MNVGSKTPVSVLQEYATAHNLILDYKPISQETGSHQPYFEWRVQVGRYWAIGSGRSKQFAKQQAAQGLLAILEKCKELELGEELDNLAVPTCIMESNPIGELDEYCEKHHHPKVTYEYPPHEGPDHARIHTVVCYVSHLRTTGQAGKKKDAKRIAANNMLLKLKEQYGEEHNPVALIPRVKKTPEKQVQSAKVDEVISKHIGKIKTGCVVTTNLYRDLDKAFVEVKIVSPILNQIATDVQSLTDDNAIDLLNKIAEELGARLNLMTIDREEGLLYYVFTLDEPSLIAGIGGTKEKAARNLISTLLELST